MKTAIAIFFTVVLVGNIFSIVADFLFAYNKQFRKECLRDHFHIDMDTLDNEMIRLLDKLSREPLFGEVCMWLLGVMVTLKIWLSI